MANALTRNTMAQVGLMRLTAALLELAATQFDEGFVDPPPTNDLDLVQFLPDVDDRRALLREYHEWDGTPELFDPLGEYRVVRDSAMMAYMGAQIQDRIEQVLQVVG